MGRYPKPPRMPPLSTNSVFYAALVSLLLPVVMSSCQSQEETMRQKYVTEGILLYRRNCANCHQADGAGLANLYPPLANSDYLKANKNAVICSIRYGQQGPIKVNGKVYNRVMPPQLQLSALEVAEITTYIYSQWGDDKRLVTAKEAEALLKECAN
ncbi:cytochrome c [Fibrella aestuarina]|uniref:Cytochrome c n=2 Tax=Fibrivirga algicola TaxID=2950420 RepID=A0ABX0QD38_9BACT|nr:cytochrome c [Fibrivirga algicola]